MNLQLLAAKFQIPFRNAAVVRPRLLERMTHGLDEQHKLALVSAPAGYGKTTLVAQWISEVTAQRKTKIACLSLDGADNDAARFLAYFISAFHRVDSNLGQGALSLLGIPQVSSPLVILDQLLNDLDGFQDRLCLVLDDYHVITAPQVHQVLEYFLNHQPPQVYLLLTTRVDPPFPLARMRARGQLTELRARDLRFTLEEARLFFNQTMRLDLDFHTIQALDARTEGWAAGMQLAALALQDVADPGMFVSDFRGSHRYVIDYLIDEVLKRQPPAVRDFLTRTSVLPRFTAGLCQAVTGDPASAEILARLERDNLFLLPLDNDRDWFRYHPLFAEALRLELSQPDEKEIHRKAAAWLEAQGWSREALAHWQAAREPVEAARLIGRLAPELLRGGELQSLLEQINLLPETVVSVSPDLVAYKSLCLLMTGQPAAARAYASSGAASTALAVSQPRDGRLLAVQAWFSVAVGDPHSAELAGQALDLLDSEDSLFCALALLAIGGHHAWNANLGESSLVFRQTWELGRRLESPFVSLGGLANLAFNLIEMGQLRQAEALCRVAFDETVDTRGRPLPVLGVLHAPLAAICYEKGDLDEAQLLAERGIALCRRLFSNEMMGGDNEITLARIAFDRGDPATSFSCLHKAAHAAEQRGLSLIVYKMALVETEFYLLQGDIPAAKRKMKDVNRLTQPALTKTSRLMKHLWARILIATGQVREGLELLRELERTDQADGAMRRQAGIHLTQALAYQHLGDLERSSSYMLMAVKFAAQEGYRSLFFDHPGRPTLALLEAARQVAPDFVSDVLKLSPSRNESKTRAGIPLIEPLSEQETRVLRLIILGKSNAEIAAELVIGIGTAKWHVHHVLQKLGVNNRAQAILRARELGI